MLPEPCSLSLVLRIPVCPADFPISSHTEQKDFSQRTRKTGRMTPLCLLCAWLFWVLPGLSQVLPQQIGWCTLKHRRVQGTFQGHRVTAWGKLVNKQAESSVHWDHHSQISCVALGK